MVIVIPNKKIKFRYFNKIKPNKFKVDFIAFDTEDNGQGAPNNFICACFYGENEKISFIKRSEARKFMLLKRKKSTVFVAHNLLYDLMNLDFPENSVELIFAKGRLIGGKYNYGNKQHTYFIDTGNFYAYSSIEELGDMIGFPKIVFNTKLIKNKKYRELNKQIQNDVVQYCMRDAEVVYKVITDLQKNNEHFGVTLRKTFTSASLALKIFRTKFYHHSIKVRPKEITNWERLAYYGGRTEVFDYNWHKKVSYIDINSSYPNQMYNKLFPRPDIYRQITNPEWKDIRSLEGMALVKIEIPFMHIPPLPYRYEGKLMFPYGTIIGCYVLPELRIAERLGCKILKVIDCIIYTETIDMFREYVDYFYNAKNNSKGILREYYKLQLNGLSGKFGEKNEISYKGNLEKMKLCDCEYKYEKNEDGEEIRFPISMKGICKKCSKIHLDGMKIDQPSLYHNWISITSDITSNRIHTFPILISYVTGYGRIQLLEQMLKCTPLYTDTDSITATDLKNIDIGNDLGQWKEEKLFYFKGYTPKVYTAKTEKCKDKECELHGEKHLHTLNRMKGVPRKHIQLDFMKYSFERPLRLSEALRRKQPPNIWIPDTKEITTTDKKRVRLEDGTSNPVYINDTREIKCFDDLIKSEGWKLEI